MKGSNEPVSRREYEQVRAELDALRAAFYSFKGALTTPDMYIQYERIPQFVGAGISHAAGTEEVNVMPERWEFIQPLPPSAGTETIEIDQGDDVTVIDTDETGKLIAIAILVTKYTVSAGAANVWLDITVDGGTTQSLQLVFNGSVFATQLIPFVTRQNAATTSEAGGSKYDAMQFPFNFEYESNLTVALRSEVTSAFTGEWDIACIVWRARKTA